MERIQVDARCLALMAQWDHTIPQGPLAGVELRQAWRFAMTLVTEQDRVCQRLVRLVELGFLLDLCDLHEAQLERPQPLDVQGAQPRLGRPADGEDWDPHRGMRA